MSSLAIANGIPKHQPKLYFMRIRKLMVAAFALFAGLAQAQQMPPIPADPDVRIGKLDNGLTYYIRHNNWPENRADFYIAQKVGAIQEEESQRGLAHFLEHMCFNGTKHFPGNDVIRYCESIGVQFGRDLNAYTAIDQTVYNISNVPTDRQSALDSCLLILSDWSNALTLDPKEIDEERGVIHEEWRMRTSASSRMFERNLPKLYPGSKYGVRYPIGLMSVIDNFKPKEIRDYYEKWYHPTNQAIIVVGNVDVDHTEKKIKELFGAFKNPANPAPIVDEQVPDNAQPIVVVDKDKEQQTNEVDLMIKHDVYPDSLKGDINYLIYQYAKNAATYMLNDRLKEKALEADCPYVEASAGDGNYIYAKTKDAFSISVSPKELDKAAESLKAAYTEALRAAKFGFTATEYARFQERYKSELDKAYSNKDKRRNSALYRDLVDNFLENDPMPSLDFTYQLMSQVVPAIPVEAVNQMMAEFVPANDSNMVVLAFCNEAEGNVYPTEAQLLGAINDARSANIEAYVDNVKNEPLMTTMPKAGKIKSETKNEKLGFTTLTLSNGVTVNLKKTDYKNDQVLLSGRGIGGSALYGPKDYTNLMVFDQVIGASGLGSFSLTELQKALAGKIANADLDIDQLSSSVSGNATPKDVETMLQMVYLYFTAINKDQKSFDNLMNQYEVQLKNRALSPDVALSDSLTATIYGHNPRVAPLTVDRLKDISYDRILEIAKERTANAKAWTFNIVGNYDEATIRQLVCQYLGALPSTKAKLERGKRVLVMANGDIDNTFKRKQETPKATSYMMWHNTDMPYNMKNDICADIAGQVLSMEYLDKIREKESAAYSVGAQGGAVQSYDNYRMFQIFAYCPMKPEKKDVAIRIMNEEVKNLENTCDAAKFQKCKEFLLKQNGDQVKTNGYWLGVINSFCQFGYDEYTDYVNTLNSLTPQDICNFMKEFNKAGNHITVTMLPEE